MRRLHVRSLIAFSSLLALTLLASLIKTDVGKKGRASVVPPQPLPLAVASSSQEAVTSTDALVVRVVDGDTLIARLDKTGEEVKVRLLGINTPESVDPRRPVQCFGKEASHFATELLQGKRVRLEEDVQADDRDKYGRLLRNIILADGRDVNATLIREGYAYAYLSFPLNKTRKVELRRLQTAAEQAKQGLWNPATCDGQK